jgi:predicted MFS family arabinose efflux permease
LGLINATGAFGALIGTILGVIVGYVTGWRMLFYITGGIGILMALLVYFSVRDIPRGSSEPELADLKIKEGLYRINLKELFSLIKKKSQLFLSLQGFFGVFPWQVLQAWIFTYMVEERGFDTGLSMYIMLIWLVSMIIGNLVGGMLGDVLFKRDIRGRAILGAVVVFLSAPTLFFTIMWPQGDVFGFIVAGTIASFILPMAGPNVSAAVMDIAEPEVRSSADALLRIFEYGGSSAAPLISGYLADMYGLGLGILYISVTTWIICGILFIILTFVITKDVLELRSKMAERAEKLKALPLSQ